MIKAHRNLIFYNFTVNTIYADKNLRKCHFRSFGADHYH